LMMSRVKSKKRKPKAKSSITKKGKKTKGTLPKLSVRKFLRFFFLKKESLLSSTIKLSLQDHLRALLSAELVDFWAHPI